MTVRSQIETLLDRQTRIKNEIENLQKECQHEVSVFSAHGSSGHWDRDDSYWYEHYCYDCKKRWTTDQGRGNEGKMKVDSIDYKKSPQVVELELKIKALM